MTSLEADCKAFEMRAWAAAWRAFAKLAGQDWKEEAKQAADFFEDGYVMYSHLKDKLEE